MKVKWTARGGGSVSADTDVNLQSVDNFFLKGTVEAPGLLEHDKLFMEIANRPAKGEAKKINFIVKDGDKVIASGS